MTAARIVSLALALAAALHATPFRAESTQQQQLILRASTNSVAVHVLVHGPKGPVRDLTAADFLLTDSGVAQEIVAMTSDRVPLDVTVVLDRLQQSEFAAVDRHPQVEDIYKLLTAEDRVGLIAVGTDLAELVPLSSPGPVPSVKAPFKSDQPALFDGIAAALFRVTPPGRQHLVLAITEGYDAYSFTTATMLTDIVQRSDAQLHVVAAEGRRLKSRTLGRAFNPMPADDALGTLVELARGTGGSVINVRMTRSITSPVRRIFDDVRSGYVLYYTPTGVMERGWHPIEVKLSRPGQFEVRARRGYAN